MMINAAAQSMLLAGAGGRAVSSNVDDAGTLPRSPFPPERSLSMNKAVIVSVAILGLSTSVALAAKTRHAKPAAAPAASAPAPAPETHIFQVSDADKKLYAKNKRESGMK
jgi:hypothetical protein